MPPHLVGVGVHVVSGDLLPELLGSNDVAVSSGGLVLQFGYATHGAVGILGFVDQEMPSALCLRLEVPVWVFCVAVTVVVNIQGHKFARFSVLYGERCWIWLLWFASISDRGAQSPTITIVVIGGGGGSAAGSGAEAGAGALLARRTPRATP